jgi:hypothetical protein
MPTQERNMSETLFERNLKDVERQLAQLTGLSITQASHPLVEHLVRAKQNYRRGDRILGCARAACAKLTVEDLREIADYDSSLLRYFRRQLRRPLTADTYFGLRHEINVTRRLIHHGVAFRKTEAPDFALTALPSHGIECTSAHIDLQNTRAPRSVMRKIEYAINNKNSYSYSTKFNVLTVDVSNLLFHEGQGECEKILSDIDMAVQVLQRTINNSHFQSVIYLYYAWKQTESGNGIRLLSCHSRLDRNAMEKATSELLGSIFPKGDIWMLGSLFMTT